MYHTQLPTLSPSQLIIMLVLFIIIIIITLLIVITTAIGSNVEFIFDHGFNPTPGWQLTDVWLTPDGMPKKGLLSFEFFAGDALNMFGCLLNRKLRGLLSALTLVDHRNLAVEYELNPLTHEAVKNDKNDNPVEPTVVVVPVATTKVSKFRKKLTASTPIPTEAQKAGTTSSSTTAAAPIAIKTIAMQFSLGPSMKCLSTQLALLSKQFKTMQGSPVGGASDGRVSHVYTIIDANDHLRTTDVSWSYDDGDYGRVESWKLT